MTACQKPPPPFAFPKCPASHRHLAYRLAPVDLPGDGSALDGDSCDDEPDGEIVGTGEHPFFVPSAECFVPLAQLAVGDELLLADGRQAEVTGIYCEWPTDGERLTTYNLEVAGSHTYFVGTHGILVHNDCNLGGFGEKFSGALRRFLKDKTPTEAMKAAILSNPKITASGVKIVTQVQWATDKFYVMLKEGKILSAKLLPNYREVKSVCGSKAGNQFRTMIGSEGEEMFYLEGMEGHHAVCKFWQKTVKKLAGKGWDDLDDVPVLILDKASHTGAGGSIHRIFEKHGIGFEDMREWQRGNKGSFADFKKAVKDAYIEFERPDVGEAVLKWFDEMNIH